MLECDRVSVKLIQIPNKIRKYKACLLRLLIMSPNCSLISAFIMIRR